MRSSSASKPRSSALAQPAPGGDGHGLGLSIVHAIVGAHEGQLSVRSRPEGGLAVEVRLPAGG